MVVVTLGQQYNIGEKSTVILNTYVSGTRFSMLDWVRVTGLSCTKGVWYIYDWDTRSSILP